MHPELIAAVKERIELGHSADSIRAELRTAGHSSDVIEQVLNHVQSNPAAEADVSPVNPVITPEPFQLSGATTLISEGLSFAKRRLDLVLLLTVPLVLMLVSEYVITNYASEQQTSLLLAMIVVTVASLVAYMMFLATALRVTTEEPAQLSLKAGFAWARKHTWGLLWIYILTVLTVYGGLLLLIIPGIVVSFLIYFSQYAFAAEGVTGINALLRSRDLVRGHAWAVVGRLLQITLIVIVVFMAVGIVVGIGSFLIPEGPIAELSIGIIGQFLSAGLTIAGLHVGMSMYRSLAAAYSPDTSTQGKRWMYVGLIWLGVICCVLVATAIVVGESMVAEERMEAEQMIIDEGDAKARAVELRNEISLPASTDAQGEEGETIEDSF